MSNTEDIWNKYIKCERTGFGAYGDVYKIKNKNNGYYYALKEIDKEKCNKSKESLLSEVEIMNKIKNENSIDIKEIIDTKNYLYIIMELCECNLEQYVKRREDQISINEIKEVLIQLNNTFKIMLNKNIIHRDLKPNNILISLNRLDKCLIKLCDYGSSKIISNIITNTISYTGSLLTMAPEILNDEKDFSKSDLWSLGIIIYYMYFKEYPYNGKNDHLLFKDINSGKKIKSINNKDLNDLMNGLLTINVKDRLSWEQYFNHPFFKQNNNYPYFNFQCQKHFKDVNYYCKNCKLNFCNDCLEKHNSHQIISFNNIGLNDNEFNIIENLFKEIETRINKFNLIKEKIKLLFNKMIKINENIYQNDYINDFKNYYINYLKFMNEKMKIEDIKIININNDNYNNSQNHIICEYDIKTQDINKEIRILNSHEEVCREDKKNYTGTKNEKEIKDKCEIYINEKKINFCYKYKFENKGKYIIKYFFNQPLSSFDRIFCDCPSIISFDFSNYHCNSVTDMGWMFWNCSSLTSLDLSNFNTQKVTNMRGMFCKSSSLTSLDLSNFNTNNVIDMYGMFCNCSSLTSLDLSNFNTNNVIDMNCMFYKCSSLTSLDLSNFNTNNVTNMGYMFYNCSSLTALNLSNFITNNVKDMSNMLSGINENCLIISNDEKIKKLK